jgi:hypothetical protein
VPIDAKKTQKVLKDHRDQAADDEEEEPEFYSALGATST